MSVSQNWLCFLNAIPADFYHLDRKEKNNIKRKIFKNTEEGWSVGKMEGKKDFLEQLNLIFTWCCRGVHTIPHGSQHLIEPSPSSPAFEGNNLLPLSPAPLKAKS